MQQRLDRERAQRGDVNVSLAWDTRDDLDLKVQCPDGRIISFRRTSDCGGRLDVDMNFAGRFSDQPVENIYWQRAEDGPRGHYRVFIENQVPKPIPYRVRVTIRGQARDYSGVAPPSARNHPVAEFDLP